MPLYLFKTEDGEVVERMFSMGDCPKKITLDDGRIAKKVFTAPNISMFGRDGHVSGDAARKLNEDMKRRQSEAGKRMKDNWESVK